MLQLDGARLLSNAAKILGSNIRRLRGEMSQGKLAKLLGVNPSLIHHWERGTSFAGGENIDKLCEFFGVKVIDLFDPSFVPAKDLNKQLFSASHLILEEAIKVINDNLPLLLIKRRNLIKDKVKKTLPSE